MLLSNPTFFFWQCVDPVTNPTSNSTLTPSNSTNLLHVPEVILLETCEDIGSSSGIAASQRITWEGNQQEVAEQQLQVTQQQPGLQPVAEGTQQQNDGISNI